MFQLGANYLGDILTAPKKVGRTSSLLQKNGLVAGPRFLRSVKMLLKN